MAVFRVERNTGYTVMSNHHLRNKELSLKAKGLLSQMLSLPEDWDYTLAGLSYINRESIDAIRTAVWELEKAGYITRRQGRDEKGKMTAIEYTIYEQPQPPELDYPIDGGVGDFDVGNTLVLTDQLLDGLLALGFHGSIAAPLFFQLFSFRWARYLVMAALNRRAVNLEPLTTSVNVLFSTSSCIVIASFRGI